MGPAVRLSVAAALLSCLCLHGLLGNSGQAFAQGPPVLHRIDHAEEDDDSGGLMPELSPTGSPQPFVPFLAPAPLAPFYNNSTPKLSGKCSLNFTAINGLMTTTAVDCFASFAPFLANVICCPQLQATLTILIGQSSKQTGSLALDPTLANYCLSDVQQLLMSQGASDNLHSICSVHLSNATEGSCPVSTVDAFESVVDSSKLLEACRKVDPVNECCSQTCQSAISDAARKISSKDAALTSDTASPKVDSCRNVVLRWLSSRLEPSSATKMLRQISNCNVNGVGSQESGCLLPSMPSDASFDPSSGISFTCDLNDNIAAPWSPSLQASASTCNKSAAPGPTIPERPAATSAQNGVNHNRLELSLAVCFGALVATILLQV
uniref:SPARK domain-containing protein n=1 Tax=Aegilops tauschii subsp. strangulata TaxID=200361 RepID=A0A453BR34_AEGTS